MLGQKYRVFHLIRCQTGSESFRARIDVEWMNRGCGRDATKDEK